MSARKNIPPDVVADVLLASRRRCCICYGLSKDSGEKRGQIAHLDGDSSNSSRDNLLFLCFDHHDQYDSQTSQSKNLTTEEVKRYAGQLDRFVTQSLPLSDAIIARSLLAALDRPAFRTPFRQESSLPRFRAAIADTIAAINIGKSSGSLSKADIRDSDMRAALDSIVERLVALRASFDSLLKTGDIRHCGCSDPDCSVHMLSDKAVSQMDHQRHDLLFAAQQIDSSFQATFYELE